MRAILGRNLEVIRRSYLFCSSLKTAYNISELFWELQDQVYGKPWYENSPSERIYNEMDGPIGPYDSYDPYEIWRGLEACWSGGQYHRETTAYKWICRPQEIHSKGWLQATAQDDHKVLYFLIKKHSLIW